MHLEKPLDTWAVEAIVAAAAGGEYAGAFGRYVAELASLAPVLQGFCVTRLEEYAASADDAHGRENVRNLLSVAQERQA